MALDSFQTDPSTRRSALKAARSAVTTYSRWSGLSWEADGPQTAIADLIADLMHLADSTNRTSGRAVLQRALDHYEAEWKSEGVEGEQRRRPARRRAAPVHRHSHGRR